MPELRYDIKVEGAGQSAGEIGRVGDAAEKAQTPQITFLGKLGEAQRKAADAGRETAESLREASRTAREAHEVISGLERGGIGGLVSALRGLIGLLRGPYAAAMGSVGVVAAGIAAPVIVGIKIMRDKFEENRKAMEDMWTGAAQRADRYKQAIEQIDTAAKKMTDDMLTNLNEINQSMSDMEGRMQQAADRSSKINSAKREQAFAQMDLQKQQELAKATTPEQRQAIEATYAQKRTDYENAAARNDLINEQLNAKLTVSNFSGQQKAARDQIRTADLEAEQAKSDYETLAARSTEAYHQYGASDYQLNLQEQAKEAKAKYDKLQEAADKVREEAGKIIEAAQKQIDQATVTLETIPIRQQTQATKEQTQAQQQLNSIKASSQIDALRKQSGDLGSSIESVQSQLKTIQDQGATLGGGGYNPERSERESALQEQLNGLLVERERTNNTLGDYTTAAARQERATQQKLQDAARRARANGDNG